jgi:uncharacterized protein (TIGR02145 family)
MIKMPIYIKLLSFIFCSIIINIKAQQVNIGGKIWSTKNLDVSKFRNGNLIKQVKTKEEWLRAIKLKQPAWCYYNNDASFNSKFGKLYNWYALIDSSKIAPSGWHVASDDEWKDLTDFLGGDNIAGNILKSKTGWESKGNGIDERGFNILPAGICNEKFNFLYFGISSYYWTSMENNDYKAVCKYFGNGLGDVGTHNFSKNIGLSVRCVKD